MTESSAQASDAHVRMRALDPGSSFLVQAPAGSGKTELLIQRYLRLLAIVDEPEEILAVTFTNKAAAEMSARVLQALARAEAGDVPDAAHLKLGYELARDVCARDRARGWHLSEQPARLHIQTLDSVNHALSGNTPLSAGLTAGSDIATDPELLFRQAAARTIGLLGSSSSTADFLRTLLDRFDNRVDLLEQQLAAMLARRDQWLPLVGARVAVDDAQLRPFLEANFALLIERELARLDALLPLPLRVEITELLAFAGTQLRATGRTGPAAAWIGRTEFPRPVADEVARWRAMARVMLTGGKTFRKQISIREGFPPKHKDEKARFGAVLEQLAELPEALEALQSIYGLPDSGYADQQWEALQALFQVLPYLAAEMKQVFAETGTTDYAEVAGEALQALGSEDAPTEFGLMLDYRLGHILLDEFQDTSVSQFHLLQRLTAGWQPRDGRTLFLVGDPMQSIYRFRQAEVGLYLDVAAHGIGDVELEFLRLSENFRSDPSIVEWLNKTFAGAMPAKGDPVAGAVPYAPAHAYRRPTDRGGVHWHVAAAGEAEAAEIIGVVQGALDADPAGEVGILVRGRAHAQAIIPALRQAGIDYLGPEFDVLERQAVAQDLLALTRALLDPADRLAWLAVLRAPWCGLSLGDLHSVANFDRKAAIAELLTVEECLRMLGADGQRRAAHARAVLEQFERRRGRLAIRDVVEGAWLKLGGPATIRSQSDLELADHFFEILDSIAAGADTVDGVQLSESLAGQRITRASRSNRVQIMTIHKAKGLEFDTVVLPHLCGTTKADDKPLLLWEQFKSDAGQEGLVFAPLAAGDEDASPAFDFLWDMEKTRAANESTRQLYVAASRAKKRLHLFVSLQTNDDGDFRSPPARSLLAKIWPQVARAIPRPHTAPEPAGADDSERWFDVRIHRLPPGWQLPEAPAGWAHAVSEAAATAEQPVEYEWVGQWPVHVGTVVHDWLRHYSAPGIELPDRTVVVQSRPAFRRALKCLGVAADDLDEATSRAVEASTGILADATGRWILSDEHAEAASELALTIRHDDGFVNRVLDRTFVDTGGVRWIIDYKTSAHTGGNLAGFLESEAERYRPQLREYRDAMAWLDARPIRTALYFPLLGELREVDVDKPAQPELTGSRPD